MDCNCRQCRAQKTEEPECTDAQRQVYMVVMGLRREAESKEKMIAMMTYKHYLEKEVHDERKSDGADRGGL